MNDTELQIVDSHLRLCEMALEARLMRLMSTNSKLSRHYSRLRHTRALLEQVQELQRMVRTDPDNWDDEPEHIPF